MQPIATIPCAVKWFWLCDSGWKPYEKAVCAMLEKEYQRIEAQRDKIPVKDQRVKLDKERYVDLAFPDADDIKKHFKGLDTESLVGMQRRFDDEMRRRAVKREVPPIFSGENAFFASKNDALSRAFQLYSGKVHAEKALPANGIVVAAKKDVGSLTLSNKNLKVLSEDWILQSISAGMKQPQDAFVLRKVEVKKDEELRTLLVNSDGDGEGMTEEIQELKKRPLQDDGGDASPGAAVGPPKKAKTEKVEAVASPPKLLAPKMAPPIASSSPAPSPPPPTPSLVPLGPAFQLAPHTTFLGFRTFNGHSTLLSLTVLTLSKDGEFTALLSLPVLGFSETVEGTFSSPKINFSNDKRNKAEAYIGQLKSSGKNAFVLVGKVRTVGSMLDEGTFEMIFQTGCPRFDEKIAIGGTLSGTMEVCVALSIDQRNGDDFGGTLNFEDKQWKVKGRLAEYGREIAFETIGPGKRYFRSAYDPDKGCHVGHYGVDPFSPDKPFTLHAT